MTMLLVFSNRTAKQQMFLQEIKKEILVHICLATIYDNPFRHVISTSRYLYATNFSNNGFKFTDTKTTGAVISIIHPHFFRKPSERVCATVGPQLSYIVCPIWCSL